MSPSTVEIAVLDDDADFRSYIDDFLTGEGYTVRCFAHPDELMEACAEKPPEIVMLDMKMGEFRGDVVLEQLQSAHPGLCIIIVTGYPSLEDMRTTFKRKVFDYVSKPFSLSQMRQVLKNAAEAYSLGQSPQDRLRKQLGHRIRLLRAEKNWALKDLAAEAKLSISQISSIERGAHMPSMESLLAICGCFGKRASEVLDSIGF